MGLYLIAHVAGQCVAFETRLIESVVDIDAIVPVPGVDPTIRGLAALRSRVIAVIDAAAALGATSEATSNRAVLAEVDGHLYALTVFSLEDVIEAVPRPLTAGVALHGAWANAAVGQLDHGEDAVLILDPAALVPAPIGTTVQAA